MRMDELKRGFWGYKKDSVYRYIVSVEERASERMAEKDAKLEQMDREAKEQIVRLETALDALRQENAALRENQTAVFTTLMEAQKYAEQLRTESLRREQSAQAEVSAALRQKAKQLEGYQQQVRQLRETVQEMLKVFDSRAEETERMLNRLQSQAPSSELRDGGPISDGSPAEGSPAAAGLTVLRGKPEQKAQEGETWKKISFI